ncbi:phosphoglycolate phosphatase [compost metagenome]
MRYLARRAGVALAEVLTCGDSGNDREMLELGCPAALVANALPEVARLSLPGVYRCRSAHAAGVQEALEHLGWL